jgi:hypothetical protein
MNARNTQLILAHFLSILAFFLSPLILLQVFPGSISFPDLLGKWAYWQFGLLFIGFFYFHYYFMLPLLFNRRSWIAYGVLLILLFVLILKVEPFDQLLSLNHRLPLPDEHNKMPDAMPQPPRVDIVSIVLFFLLAIAGLTVDMNRRWRETILRAKKAEADKAQAELSFLRAQVNPHFLFNTLNNIYSMAVTHHEHTAESIMKLSNIMRYVTDEAHDFFVPLEQEIDCITDYIDLQKLRLGRKVQLHYKVSGYSGDKQIAPLLLMSFIENVFKYGTSNHTVSKLVIGIDIQEQQIHFHTENPLYTTARLTERDGIGISNTTKRLQQLYPGKHELAIIREEGLFQVRLTIDL